MQNKTHKMADLFTDTCNEPLIQGVHDDYDDDDDYDNDLQQASCLQ